MPRKMAWQKETLTLTFTAPRAGYKFGDAYRDVVQIAGNPTGVQKRCAHVSIRDAGAVRGSGRGAPFVGEGNRLDSSDRFLATTPLAGNLRSFRSSKTSFYRGQNAKKT